MNISSTSISAASRFALLKSIPDLPSSGSTDHGLLQGSLDPHQDPLWKLNQGPSGELLVHPDILSNLLYVRNFNRHFVEIMEGQSRFEVKPWTKEPGSGAGVEGGGVMSVLRGQTIEKSAVNMSLVTGPQYPSIEANYAGKPFTACGVSLIAHPLNPHGPIAHMNVRVLQVGQGAEKVTWIGGGGDLTPMFALQEDTDLFHSAFKKVCDEHPLGDYEKYKKWCDEYFFIPHRNQMRGVGGIFFDYVAIEEPAQSFFLVLVAQAFARSYAEILSKRLELSYTEEDKEKHLYWRGRYAEFNLVYDRGTRFGLMSGGNTEAIFGSLPPVVKW